MRNRHLQTHHLKTLIKKLFSTTKMSYFYFALLKTAMVFVQIVPVCGYADQCSLIGALVF